MDGTQLAQLGKGHACGVPSPVEPTGRLCWTAASLRCMSRTAAMTSAASSASACSVAPPAEISTQASREAVVYGGAPPPLCIVLLQPMLLYLPPEMRLFTAVARCGQWNVPNVLVECVDLPKLLGPYSKRLSTATCILMRSSMNPT